MRGATLGIYAAQGVSGASGYPGVILATPGLVAYYPMNETSGTVCADSTVRFAGTYTGSFAPGSGHVFFGNPGATAKLGTSVDFNYGSRNYVSVPYNAALAPSAAMSVECWVAGNTVSFSEIVCKPFTSLASPFFDYSISGGRGSAQAAFFLAVGTTLFQVNSTATLVGGTWYHIVGTYNGTDIRIYINGALNCTPVAVTGSIRNSSTPLTFATAGSWTTEDYVGKIQQVAIYNVALPAATVLAHYNAAF